METPRWRRMCGNHVISNNVSALFKGKHLLVGIEAFCSFRRLLVKDVQTGHLSCADAVAVT